MPNAEVFYLKELNGGYTNGYRSVSKKWEAMKNTSEAEHWLYTGAQHGVRFTYEFKALPITKDSVSEWESNGYVIRDV